MELKVLDITGKEQKTIKADDKVFGAKVNQPLLAQYIRVFLANARQGTASTKTRGEVSGSGHKPWKQKGTGRARHGSIRSPIWPGGGVSHGPKPKSWSLAMPKKMKRLAMISALSFKGTSNKITILDSLTLSAPKTSQMDSLLKTLNSDGKSTLFILNTNDLNVRKSITNIANATTALVQNVNPYEVTKAKNIIIEQAAVDYLNDKYKTL